MGNKTKDRRGTVPSAPQDEQSQCLLPVCDTVSGRKAATDPDAVVRHYERLAGQLWLSPRVREFSDAVLGDAGAGRVRWASLSAPYGYGKTATGVALWRHARAQG